MHRHIGGVSWITFWLHCLQVVSVGLELTQRLGKAGRWRRTVYHRARLLFPHSTLLLTGFRQGITDVSGGAQRTSRATTSSHGSSRNSDALVLEEGEAAPTVGSGQSSLAYPEVAGGSEAQVPGRRSFSANSSP